MGHQAAFHAPHGGADFLAMRINRQGRTEIVYDDGVARRMTWRVDAGSFTDERLSDALRAAVTSLRVVPALYDELRKRAIAVEQITG